VLQPPASVVQAPGPATRRTGGPDIACPEQTILVAADEAQSRQSLADRIEKFGLTTVP